MENNEIVKNTQEVKENKILIAAPASTRFFAFLIDVFFVYLLRYFYISFSFVFWLKKPIEEFLKRYEMLYGKFNYNNITNIELNYFFNSVLFKQIIIFIIGIFLIAVLYNLIFFLTKWSATIGQKIMGIYVVNKNGEKMKSYQAIARSVLLMVPWAFLFVIMFYKTLSDFNLAEQLDKTSFIISIFIFLSWYDLIFLTKNKLVFHDYITSTRTITKNTEKYLEDQSNSIWKILFPNFGDMYKNLKEFTKNQVAKAKEIRAKYKEEKELNKKDKK